MATTTNFATAASGTSWTTPTNANVDDGAYATYTIAAKNTTGNVNSLSIFGFDAAIPSGATINSVTLEVQHKVSTTGGIAFLESALAIGATVGTYNSDGTEPTADTVATYSAMTRPGGGSWTRADLLDGTFTVKLRARSGNNATSVAYSWDYAKVTVDYTPQAFTLTALAGAYTLTGQAATVSRDIALTATAGSYTLSGVNTTLTYTPAITGFELTALAGSYALTGQAATVSRNRALTASAGSYTLSGVNADLTKSKLITANAGSYAFSGQNADLTHVAPGAYALTALVGNYTLTGQSATIEFVGVETEPQRVFGGDVTPWQRRLWRKIEDEPQSDEIVKAIEAVAEQVITKPDTLSQQVAAAKQVRTALENMGIAYKEAYQEIYLDLLAEMQQAQEDEQIAAVVAALL